MCGADPLKKIWSAEVSG